MATKKALKKTKSILSPGDLKSQAGKSKAKLKSKAKSKRGAAQKGAAFDNWPLKRDVFFRPDRKKYVKKEIKSIGCVFCRSASQALSIETLCVYKSKYSQIVLNKFPYNNGHLLVLPLNHGGDLLKLSSEEYVDLGETLKLAVKAIQKIYEPTGFNIGLNHGLSGGAGIPDHLHYHVIPRWSGDVNFFPLIAETKVVIETLEESFKSFFNYFNMQKVTT